MTGSQHVQGSLVTRQPCPELLRLDPALVKLLALPRSASTVLW